MSGTHVKLVLGSTSPFRRQLLERLQLDFETGVPKVDETRHPGEAPTDLVQRLARLKAEAVAAQIQGPALVIGSDQCAVLGEEVLGKPGTHEKATAQLRACSGQTVVFHTGLCLLDTRGGNISVDDVIFEVGFRELSDAEIDSLVEQRITARKEKNWGMADKIRDDLQNQGILLEDGPEGTTWRRKPKYENELF